jgi:hypothetical protein
MLDPITFLIAAGAKSVLTHMVIAKSGAAHTVITWSATHVITVPPDMAHAWVMHGPTQGVYGVAPHDYIPTAYLEYIHT